VRKAAASERDPRERSEQLTLREQGTKACPVSVGNRAPPHGGGVSRGVLSPGAQDRAPLSWTNERADTLFVCE